MDLGITGIGDIFSLDEDEEVTIRAIRGGRGVRVEGLGYYGDNDITYYYKGRSIAYDRYDTYNKYVVPGFRRQDRFEKLSQALDHVEKLRETNRQESREIVEIYLAEQKEENLNK